MCVLLGGRLAEEIMCGNITTGACDDVEKLTALAYQFVGNFAMDSNIGTFHYDRKGRGYSEALREQIDREVQKIIQTCYDKTKKIIQENKTPIKKMTAALLEKETLNQEDIKELFK